MSENVVPFTSPKNRRQASPPRVLAVTSGKGGVGKTHTTLNLACALSKNNHKVMVMDADLGLGNIDVMLGLSPKMNLSHVINGEATLNDIVMRGPHQILVVPASSGLAELTTLSIQAYADVIHSFSDLIWPLDYLLIDTAAGISPMATVYAKAAHEVIVVITEDPSSLADAYALIKLIHQDSGIHKFLVVCSMVSDVKAGERLFSKLTKVTSQFLNLELTLLASVPFDPRIKKAALNHQLISDSEEDGPAKQSFKLMAEKLNNLPKLALPNGGLEFFLERFYSAKGES